MSNNQTETKYPYGYGLSKISLLKLYMNKASVGKWSTILSISGFIMVSGWPVFRNYIFVGNVYIFLDSYVVALGLLVWGFLGMFWAYRWQVPQAVMVKGRPAYIMGLFMMTGSWLLSLRFLIIGTQNLIDFWMK